MSLRPLDLSENLYKKVKESPKHWHMKTCFRLKFEENKLKLKLFKSAWDYMIRVRGTV